MFLSVFSAGIIAFGMLSGGIAAVALPDASPVGGQATQLSKRDNRCGVSQFFGETSDASPFYFDCLALRNNIEGPGTWTLAANEARDLASYGSCKFRVKVYDNLGAQVGNEDIRDLIWDSIQKYKGHGGRVGASGRMLCLNLLGHDGAAVNWYIMNTNN